MTQQIHPIIGAEIRKLREHLTDLKQDHKLLLDALEAEKRARESLARNTTYIDDIPGKQLPFKYQINIPITNGSTSSVTRTVEIHRDGPFIARRLFCSILITSVPTITRSQGSTTAAFDFTHMINRYIPVTSSPEYSNWALANYNYASGVGNNVVLPPLFDFEWEYDDGSSDRRRQKERISGDVFAKHDEDGYFMNNEMFDAGSIISFTIHPLHAASISIVDTDQEPDETLSGNFNIEVQMTFDGFKVLQPLEF